MTRKEPGFEKGQNDHENSGSPDVSTLSSDELKDMIAQLATMRAAGEITGEEFKAAKAKVLGAGAAAPSSKKPNSGKTPSGQNTKGNVGAFVIVCLAILFGLAFCQQSPEDKASAAAKEAAERQQGFHCLSKWDGANRDFVTAVTNSLREPSSFEHIETLISPLREGKHAVFMKYRARNGFGGMSVEDAAATIDPNTCKVIQWANM